MQHSVQPTLAPRPARLLEELGHLSASLHFTATALYEFMSRVGSGSGDRLVESLLSTSLADLITHAGYVFANIAPWDLPATEVDPCVQRASE
jgi:hypothetical protein